MLLGVSDCDNQPEHNSDNREGGAEDSEDGSNNSVLRVDPTNDASNQKQGGDDDGGDHFVSFELLKALVEPSKRSLTLRFEDVKHI